MYALVSQHPLAAFVVIARTDKAPSILRPARNMKGIGRMENFTARARRPLRLVINTSVSGAIKNPTEKALLPS